MTTTTARRLFVSALLFSLGAIAVPASAADVQSILFPVIGTTHYSDDFGAPRVGHTHEGNDIFAHKLQTLVAAVSGFIRFVAYPEPSWGYSVTLEGSNGYTYHYLHVNNDNPGTDDGNGGGYHAYAPYMQQGFPVVRGQRIGYVGDSGNAETTSSHLHFEIRRPDGVAIDPYLSLHAAARSTKPVAPPALPGETLPFGEFTGGATLAVSVATPAQPSLLIVGAGPGATPRVVVYTKEKKLLGQFYAYNKSFRGGVDVTTADTNGDGIPEIITTPGPDMAAEVRIFSLQGVLQKSFVADRTLTTGLHVSAADLDGDGKAEIATGTLAGSTPEVRVFDAQGNLQTRFFAYEKSFRGGIDVAAAAATEATQATIVTSPGAGHSPQVREYTTQGVLLGQFLPYSTAFRGGVRIAVGEVSAESAGPEVLTVPAGSGGPDFRVYSMQAHKLLQLKTFETWWRGGYDIAASSGFVALTSTSGGRRVSIRTIDLGE